MAGDLVSRILEDRRTLTDGIGGACPLRRRHSPECWRRAAQDAQRAPRARGAAWLTARRRRPWLSRLFFTQVLGSYVRRYVRYVGTYVGEDYGRAGVCIQRLSCSGGGCYRDQFAETLFKMMRPYRVLARVTLSLEGRTSFGHTMHMLLHIANLSVQWFQSPFLRQMTLFA